MGTPLNPTILHIDDNEIKRYSVSKTLRNAGFSMVTAVNGAEGLQLMQRLRPALVLLDINLPDMSGYEVCRRIKSSPDLGNTIVLHMSASFVKSDDQVRGLQGGADGYITEPVEPDVLIATINAALRIRKAELESLAAKLLAEQAQVRLKVLADVGHLLSESLAPQDALESVVDLLIPNFADIAVVILFDENGKCNGLASGHTNEEQSQILKNIFELYPPSINVGPQVLRKRPEVVLHVNDAWLKAYAHNDKHFRQLKGLGANTALICGLVARGKQLGVIALAFTGLDRTFSSQDVEFIEGLSHRMAVLVDNSRLLQQAQNHNRLKDEFLAALAHELRNPLAPIHNAAELMRTHKLDSEHFERLRQMISKQVGNISRIIEDLTDVARIEHGKLTLRCTTVDLISVIRQAIDICQEQIERKHQTLKIELCEGPVYISGDLTRLEQIIINLVQNATKYTPAKGTIIVRLERKQEIATICVQDSGVGISPAVFPRIFELFSQAPQSLDRPEGGLGIGLTIVRHLVLLHGGTIAAHSDGLNKGSEFTVNFPLSHQVILPQITASSETMKNTVTLRHRMLLVEDNEDIRETMQMLLQMWGHDTKIVETGMEALALIENWKPTVIMLDIGLPGLNGFEVAKKIRAISLWSDIYLIAITGYGSPQDIQKANDAGFNQLMVKPVDIDKLQGILNGPLLT